MNIFHRLGSLYKHPITVNLIKESPFYQGATTSEALRKVKPKGHDQTEGARSSGCAMDGTEDGFAYLCDIHG